MTTEEKAKAYDEALKRAREKRNEYKRLDPKSYVPQDIEYIFSVLKESEDERIRKEMIAFLKSEKAFQTIDLPKSERWITYLERQKEQNGEEDKDFTIYHPLKNECTGEYECFPYSFYGSLTSFSEDKDLIDFLRTCFYTEEECNDWIEQQKKPENVSATTMIPYCWSEEDDAKVKAMCAEGNLKPTERAWLKNLRNRVQNDKNEKKPTVEEVLIRAGLKPFKDGNQWCILVGDNIQEGVCGFGDTIEDALFGFLKDVVSLKKPFNVCEQCPYYKECPNYNASKAIEAVDRIDKYIDENTANAHDMEDSNPDKKYYSGWDDALAEMSGILQDVYSENQKEQNTTDSEEKFESIDSAFRRGREVGFHEGTESVKRSTEWNTEDYHLEGLVQWLRDYQKTIDRNSNNMAYEDVERYIDWINRIKSLHPQPHKEIYQAAKHDLAIKFMNYLDENRPEGKMSLSNGECEDIDKAFKENDWAKVIRYAEKYCPSWKPSEEQMKALRNAVNKLAKTDVADSVRLSIMYDNLKKLM